MFFVLLFVFLLFLFLLLFLLFLHLNAVSIVEVTHLRKLDCKHVPAMGSFCDIEAIVLPFNGVINKHYRIHLQETFCQLNKTGHHFPKSLVLFCFTAFDHLKNITGTTIKMQLTMISILAKIYQHQVTLQTPWTFEVVYLIKTL